MLWGAKLWWPNGVTYNAPNLWGNITRVKGVYIKNYSKEMVFCYQKCSDLLWEKNILVIEKNFWGHYLEQYIFKQLKGRTIFGNRMLFLHAPGGFSYLIDMNN